MRRETKKRGRNDTRRKKNSGETRCETKKNGETDAKQKNGEKRHKTKKNRETRRKMKKKWGDETRYEKK